MLLFHVTPRRNLPSIFQSGLLPEWAEPGRPERVWLSTTEKLYWCFVHVASWQACPVAHLVALVVDVPRGRLCHRRRGIWYTSVQICPDQIFPYQLCLVNTGITRRAEAAGRG